ncbi:MAG TPA: pyruvate:ferredoxin (flavodoxin) oxidoreductase [Bacteroidales bacterium]|nr:pyruvate:ferredoxin (flavodoxin) oxidoreductase [Bacteroidales bacterium]HQN16858.1 pyruvate:ferredoxin (flavodoxin) oxidoreductase [Bacteroidales bacterium]HQP16452.1 pyruvate:ferredoxin (flavodoxin) oxidoreductase [Bacteroidales bacterium]
MEKKSKFITCDGNYAAAYIAYMFTEVACIYPITPSSNMAENIDEWAAAGKKNIFGETVSLSEMQSEAGAAGALHGALQAGTLAATYTASQGLLLMIPNMYKIAGELLPGVLHVSARSLAAQALSIFGDHSDVMATRNTGFAMLATGSVQEIMDIAGVAHFTALKSRVPFLHFFDGFRTSHEIQKVEAPAMEDMEKLLDKQALKEFRQRALNPEHPVTRGTAQNPDIYFQTREVANKFYEAVPDMVEHYMQEMQKITGREYHPFTYYGAPDAENVIVAMGSITETIKEVIDHLVAKGEKVGLISVHLYRPFSEKYFMNVYPKTAKRVTVLDRTKEPGANGDPLYLDVRDLFYGKPGAPMIVGGRYGLSSKDTTPAMMLSVFENMKMNEPKNQFTVGIVDDVTFKSLPLLPEISVAPEGTYEAKFYGLGSDGTVGANKNSIKIISETTDKYCQAYFAYDSKKSGGITVSHLRFGDKAIRSPYLVNTPNFVACHVPAYLEKYDMLKGLKNNGTFLLNSIWDVEETKAHLPNHIKKYLAANNIKFYIINATKIAEEIGLGTRTNTIMQTAFFKVSNVIPFDLAVTQMKKAIEKTYGRKGEDVVKKNIASIDDAIKGVVEVPVPADWKNLPDDVVKKNNDLPDFIKNVFNPINAQKGDDLPVSAFLGREDGTFPSGTTRFEKRGIAVNVPEWVPENCIQCNQCAFVCPHAAIRPFLLNDEDVKNAPAGTKTLKAVGKELEGLQFRMQVSVLDCTGCENCADVCPAKTKALVMKPLGTQQAEIERFTYMDNKVGYKSSSVDIFKIFKNSQFAQPLFEFSGACAGCGETPYIKLVTQLFGERMIVANATGCSSIYGGSAPSTPYSIAKSGKGVAWGNSLFEDNAEYGYGIESGVRKMRQRIQRLMKTGMDSDLSAEIKDAFKAWLEGMNNAEASKAASEKVLALIEKSEHPLAKQIVELKDYLVKKSIWIFGGDGWAYDIGYGGLDHVLASGEDVNVLVLDTEVYSNTGGQASKSTPIAAVAKFAAAGKRIRKKDLGMMAMSYGYVYVAQVAIGASYAQYFKAVKEAEAYPGPSLIIAYAPCINHGLRAGMGKSQQEAERAVEAGYWHLYRYNPMLEKEGKNPFTLDSKEPKWEEFQNFLAGEVRYTSLKSTFPEEAEALFKAAEENARWRYKTYVMKSQMQY